MGSGPVSRSIAAAVTLGTSELGQKKPFQNITDKDEPIGGASGGPLRFLPGAIGVTPAIDALTPKAPQLPQVGTPGEAPTVSPLEPVAEKVKRTKRNFTTVLTDPLTLGTSTTSIGRSTLLGSGFNKTSFGR